MPSNPGEKCLTEGCFRHEHKRGLCPRCYKAAWRYVKSEKDTWDNLILAGLVKQARKGENRESENIFLKSRAKRLNILQENVVES